jgi:hypothetical protein
MNCEDCFYGLFQPQDNIVICRRYPPLVTRVEGNQITSHNPLVHPRWWCGEWKQEIDSTNKKSTSQPQRVS